MEEKIIWSIGHSIHNLETFIIMLKSYGIDSLADIRTYPGSSRYPHFNKEVLELALKGEKIGYVHIKELGGRRKVAPDSRNSGWRLASFRGYADYMETESFIEGIRILESYASVKRTAMMCSENLWWKCHRSLVSDYLKFTGWKVVHIMTKEKSMIHPYTKPAQIKEGRLLYHS